MPFAVYVKLKLSNAAFFCQRTSGRVILEIARLKHGTSSRPSSMSSLPNIQLGAGSLSSMENIAVNIPLGK